MKKVLFLTSFFALILSVTSFAQSGTLPKTKQQVMAEKAEREKMAKSEFDCNKLDLKVVKKESQYEVVLNTTGEKPHHWDLIPLSRSESNSRSKTTEDYTILTTKRNKINVSKDGKYLLNVMSAEDDIVCSTPLDFSESNSRSRRRYMTNCWPRPWYMCGKSGWNRGR